MKKIHWVGLVLVSLFLGSCTDRSATDSAVIFSDDFNRADEALSASANWAVSVSGGTFNVVSQMAKATGSIPQAYYNVKVTNGVGVSTTMKVSGGTATNSEYFVALLKDSFLYTTATASYICGVSSGQLSILDNVSNVKTGTLTHALTTGTSWTLTMSRSGSTITCSLTGPTSESISYTDSTSPFTDGYFGYIYNKMGGADYLSFDDFTIF